MDLSSCNKCDFVDDVNQVGHAFVQQFYVDEIMHLAKDVP